MIDHCIYIYAIYLQSRQIINNEYYRTTSMILDFNRFYGHDLMCIDSES